MGDQRRKKRRKSRHPGEPTRRAAAAPPLAPAVRRRARLDEAPPAPWGAFPLVELCVLAALILGVAGLIVWGETGRVLLACGVALGSLAGLELSVREHFAGYRSHTLVLAGTLCVAAMAVVFVARGPRPLLLGTGALTLLLGSWFMRRAYARRSGGLTTR